MNLQEMLFIARGQLKDYGQKKWSESELIAYANMGKSELVSIVRAAREDYFLASTTSTVSATTTPNPSELILPTDFLELKDIYCIQSGYEEIHFMETDRAKREFRRTLIDGPELGTDIGTVLYDIYGNSTIAFAPGFHRDMDIKIDYISDVADMVLPEDTVSPIPAYLHDFIPNYMSMVALRSAGDKRYRVFAEAVDEQTSAIRTQIQPRQIREPRFVRGFMEDF